MLTIGDTFPEFSLQSVVDIEPGKEFETLTNASYPGKWRVVFFWPMDFTFICPTEIAEFGRRNQDFLDRDSGKGPVCSNMIAQSVHTNPVVIRRLMSELEKASLVASTSGRSGGFSLARPAPQITLADVYRAVEDEAKHHRGYSREDGGEHDRPPLAARQLWRKRVENGCRRNLADALLHLAGQPACERLERGEQEPALLGQLFPHQVLDGVTQTRLQFGGKRGREGHCSR